MGESRTPRPEPFAGDHYERVRWFVVDRPDGHRHPAGRSSHVPLRSGLSPGYATLARIAAPLNDASTTRGTEVASTLTLAAYAARARADWRLPGTSFCCLINEA